MCQWCLCEQGHCPQQAARKSSIFIWSFFCGFAPYIVTKLGPGTWAPVLGATGSGLDLSHSSLLQASPVRLPGQGPEGKLTSAGPLVHT